MAKYSIARTKKVKESLKSLICNYVKDSTVGKYTGLLDHNGNLIFEGDILRTAAGFGGVVTWHSNCYFFINTKTNTDTERSYAPSGEILTFASFTVIGNIHDNPDKLNEL